MHLFQFGKTHLPNRFPPEIVLVGDSWIWNWGHHSDLQVKSTQGGGSREEYFAIQEDKINFGIYFNLD